MLTTTQLANILQGLAVAAIWSCLIFGVIRYARLDDFRQRMFAVRDELFDFAADGNISFNHPAYTLLREQMNGFIRYGHDLTVFRLLMTALMAKITGRVAEKSWFREWKTAVDSIADRAVREKLEFFHDEGMTLVVKRLVIGSPVLWCMTALFVIQALAEGASKGIDQVLRMAASRTLAGPINRRHIEEAAFGELV